MRTSKATSHMLAASVPIAMLAACSGSSPQMAPGSLGAGGAIQSQRQQAALNGPLNRIAALRGFLSGHHVTTPSFMDPGSVGKPLLFVADYNNGVVNIYRQGNPKKVGQITGLNAPNGLTTDTAANLYVAILANGHSQVFVYAPAYTGPPTLTLDDGINLIINVAVSRSGVVAVANYCAQPSCPSGSGNVNFYAPNATTPCATVADPANFAYIYGDAFDDKGNLFIDGQNPAYSGIVGKINGGCKAKSVTPLTTTNTIAVAGDIDVYKNDGIALLDNSSVKTIYTYRAPKRGALGSPVRTTPLATTQPNMNAFAFVASGADIYTAEADSSFNSGAASEYDYPAGGGAEATIPFKSGDPVAVAVTPPLVP
jgi:hypothetical protein